LARWHLSWGEETHRIAEGACLRAGLQPSGAVSDGALHCQAYFKRAIRLDTFVELADGKWICSAGTVIVSGKMGAEALKECFAEFARNGARGVQERALGHYALAVRDGSRVTVFTDPMGSVNLYYATWTGGWTVCNSLQVCAMALPEKRLDSTRLLIHVVRTNLPGEETFYTGVKRLFGTQVIEIGVADGSFQVQPILEGKARDWNLPTIEDAVEQYADEMRGVFRELAGLGRIGVLGTGGLDSRTVLAGLVDQKAEMELMYGWGDSHLTDYNERDRDLSRALADANGLPFTQLDWSGAQPFSAAKLESLFQKYGFRSEIYGAPDGFLETFEKRLQPYPALLVGGYSPAFTNSKPWQLKAKSFPLPVLVEDCMRCQGGSIQDRTRIRNKEKYRAEVEEQLRVGLRCGGMEYDERGASLEEYVRAKLFLYIRAESRFLNLMNDFCSYVAPFLQERLYDPLLRIPLRYRVGDEFQIRLIGALAPGLLELPLYSGWSEAQIDRATYRLVRREEVDRKLPVKGRVAQMLPKEWLRRLRAMRSRLQGDGGVVRPMGDPKDGAIFAAYSEAIMQDPLGREWLSGLDGLALKEVTRMRHYLSGVNILGYSTLSGQA
jgi:hypothetical protein